MGNTEIEDSLQRLDKLTHEEAKMASAELLRITHSVEGRVIGVEAKVEDIGGDVQNVDKRVHVVDDRVQGVDEKIQGIDVKVKDVGNGIQDIDSKLDDTRRSSPLLFIISSAQASLQGTYSVVVFYSGFRLQIHAPTITLHPMPITTAQLNGFLMAVFLKNGNLLVPSCGFTENVCSSLTLLRATNPDHFLSIAGSGKSVLRFVLLQLVLRYQTDPFNSALQSYKIS